MLVATTYAGNGIITVDDLTETQDFTKSEILVVVNFETTGTGENLWIAEVPESPDLLFIQKTNNDGITVDAKTNLDETSLIKETDSLAKIHINPGDKISGLQNETGQEVNSKEDMPITVKEGEEPINGLKHKTFDLLI